MKTHCSHLALPLSAALALSAGALPAQCGPTQAVHSPIGGQVAALAPLPDGRIVAGGWFSGPSGLSRVGIYDRTSQTWDRLAGGCNGTVQAVVTMPNGDIVAGGHFSMAGGTAVENIARWNGTSWSPISAGTSGGAAVGATIYSLLVLPNGDLLAGGDFQQIEGVAVQGLARWNGAAWSSIGYPYQQLPLSLTLTPAGDLIVVDLLAIERWDGSTWSIETAFFSGYVNVALALADGSVVVGGGFSSIGAVAATNVARLQGGVWTPLGVGVDGICAGLTQLPDGDVVVVGNFAHATDAAGSTLVDGIARWDGQHWTAFGGSGHGNVQAIVRNVDDSYSFAGAVTVAGATANRFATLTSACPAGASPFGLGCPSSAGAVALAADARPWLGATYAAHATGLPAASLAVGVYGFAPAAMPLAPLLPSGPGCFLFSTPDVLDLLLPSAGSVAMQLPVSGSAALVGATVHHQVLAFALGGAGIVDVSASNGLLLTIGSL